MALHTYIAFLRGINVGGQKRVAMQTLRNLCAKNGFQEVNTYIQSGNVVFKSDMKTTYELETLFSKIILDEFGFNVMVLVKSIFELKDIVLQNPFTDQEDLDANHIYFVMLKSSPDKDRKEIFENQKFTNEEFRVNDYCVYLNCKSGYGKAKLNNNLVERRLKVSATTRNFKTMKTLLELAETV